MSLRRALAALPDDRDSLSAFREVVAFLHAHPSEDLLTDRVSRATGVPEERATRVLATLAKAYVVDFDGSTSAVWRYTPTPVAELEIRRFLRESGGAESRLQRGADRFRQRFTTGR